MKAFEIMWVVSSQRVAREGYLGLFSLHFRIELKRHRPHLRQRPCVEC